MTNRKLAKRIDHLETRVEGMEELLAELTQGGRLIAISPPGPDDHHLTEAAKRAEAELQEPAPDGRY
ncbi:MAG TPA: hypothetical protein VLC07_09280 [Solirubrobacterales bacterium]|nr:hypothetical protein [Solirubrobacterales bacterium]